MHPNKSVRPKKEARTGQIIRIEYEQPSDSQSPEGGDFGGQVRSAG